MMESISHLTMGMDRQTFPISELSQRSGVPPSTIHHYVRLHLLPAPQRVAANRFLYGPDHLKALTIVRALREKSLSLGETRVVLPELMKLSEEEFSQPWVVDKVIGQHLWKTSRDTPDARLLAVAMDAFSQRGYEGVNVEDLCVAAGVSKGSFYRYFESKEALFFAAGEAAVVEIAQRFDAVCEEPPSVDDAGRVLSGVLAGRLPLFLELLMGALRGQGGYADVALKVMVALAYEVGMRLRTTEPLATGAMVIQQAAVGTFWTIFEAEQTSSAEQ